MVVMRDKRGFAHSEIPGIQLQKFVSEKAAALDEAELTGNGRTLACPS